MSCAVTNIPLEQNELDLHDKVLCDLGWGPKKYIEDEYGEQYPVDRFVDFFKRRLKARHIRFDFSKHAQLCTYAANVPQYKDFEDALYRARNFELSRILTMTKACLENQTYRERFMDNPRIDGTMDTISQATEFFNSKYQELQNKFNTIMEQYQNATTEQEYLDVLDHMLDLRYGKDNRRPNPWTCVPKAQIHPNDVDKFK